VPAPLVARAVEAALSVAAGQAAAGVVSAQVAALLEGGMKAMRVKKLTIALAVLLLVGIVVGVGLPRPQAAGEQGAAARQPALPRVLELASRGRRVVWSPDGKTLAVVTKNESLFNRKGSAIKLWDVEKGQVRETVAESTGGGLAFQQVAFSADGKTIAATVSEEVILPNMRLIRSVVKVWDAKTLVLKQTLGNNDSQLVHVAFSPNGQLVAACDPSKKTVNLWNAGTGALERTLDTGKAQPWSAAFSPDNKTLVVGGQNGDHSGEVTLWNVKTGKLKHRLAQVRFVTAVAFSPDGKMVASSDGGELVQVWSVEKGKRIVALKGNQRGPRTVAFLSDSRVVAVGGSDGKVRLWGVQTGKLHRTLEGHTAEIYSIACSPDGKTLASVSQDQTLRLWPINKRTARPK
jgi:WD40 repeat protein